MRRTTRCQAQARNTSSRNTDSRTRLSTYRHCKNRTQKKAWTVRTTGMFREPLARRLPPTHEALWALHLPHSMRRTTRCQTKTRKIPSLHPHNRTRLPTCIHCRNRTETWRVVATGMFRGPQARYLAPALVQLASRHQALALHLPSSPRLQCQHNFETPLQHRLHTSGRNCHTLRKRCHTTPSCPNLERRNLPNSILCPPLADNCSR